MRKRSGGFTMIEMVIALMIGTILIGLALPIFQGVRSRMAVRGARTMYATLQQRARARAVELGETVWFFVDAAGDSAFIVAPSVGISDVTRFRSEMNVDIRAPSNYMLCMTPRGYADYQCGSAGGFITATTSSTIKLEFWQNADSASVLVLPMGQLVGL